MSDEYIYVGDLKPKIKSTIEALVAYSNSGQKQYSATRQYFNELYSQWQAVGEVIADLGQVADSERWVSPIYLDRLSQINLSDVYETDHELINSDFPFVSTDYKQVMFELSTQFSAFSKILIADKHIAMCQELIVKWFELRFNRKTHPNFGWDPNRIPTYVDQIIITFVKYASRNNTDEFIGEFTFWLDGISRPSAAQQYIVPDDVRNIGSDWRNIVPDTFRYEDIIKKSLYTNEKYFCCLNSIKNRRNLDS